MNLGTIAHLQYYFARTGLLDTATGRAAKARKPGSRTASGNEPVSPGLDGEFPLLSPSSPDPMSEFRGMINDLRRRAPYYWSDWRDAWDYRVVPATVYMYFAK